MDLLTIMGIVLRRWLVVVPIVLLSLGAAWYVQSGIPRALEARGSVLLEEPQFDPSRRTGTAITSQSVITMLEADGLADAAAAEDVVVVPRPRDATTIEFTAVGSSEDATVRAVEDALARARSQVDATQESEDVPPNERIAATVLTPVITAQELPDGTFQAVGSVYLSDPNAGAENPYTASGATTSVIQAVVDSDAGRARVAERAPGIDFSLMTTRDAAHIIEITTTGSDPTAVLAGFNAVRDVLNEELDARQARADVTPARRIVVTDLAVPQSVADVSPPLNRAVAAIIGLGGLLAVASAVALESVLGRRRRSRPSEAPHRFGDSGLDLAARPVEPVMYPPGEEAPSQRAGSHEGR